MAVDFHSGRVQPLMIPQKKEICFPWIDTEAWTRPRIHTVTPIHRSASISKSSASLKRLCNFFFQWFLSYSESARSDRSRRWHFYKANFFLSVWVSLFPFQSLELKASLHSFKVASLWNKFDYQGLVALALPSGQKKKEKKKSEKKKYAGKKSVQS